jgi:hypothetical protein
MRWFIDGQHTQIVPARRRAHPVAQLLRVLASAVVQASGHARSGVGAVGADGALFPHAAEVISHATEALQLFADGWLQPRRCLLGKQQEDSGGKRNEAVQREHD